MRLLARAAIAASLLLASAAPAFAHQGTGYYSWGKPDTSFTAYRKDAAGCTWSATVAMMSDHALSSEGSGLAIVPSGGGGDSTLDPMVIYLSSYLMERHRDRRVDRDLRQDVINQCLMELGYQRFRLTEAQRDHLSTLEHGSKERHLYLYSLGADPAILSAQAEPLDSDRRNQFRPRPFSE
jgi:hypothetical protein